MTNCLLSTCVAAAAANAALTASSNCSLVKEGGWTGKSLLLELGSAVGAGFASLSADVTASACSMAFQSFHVCLVLSCQPDFCHV